MTDYVTTLDFTNASDTGRSMAAEAILSALEDDALTVSSRWLGDRLEVRVVRQDGSVMGNTELGMLGKAVASALDGTGIPVGPLVPEEQAPLPPLG